MIVQSLGNRTHTGALLTLVGVVIGINIAANAHAIAALRGVLALDVTSFITWLALLAASNGALAWLFWRAADQYSKRSQVLMILWAGIALWYWTIAPLYYLLVINIDAQQLAWSAFAFFWEVPVIGGGLFIALSLVLFRPFHKVISNPKHGVANPAQVYMWTFRYPLVVGWLLFAISILGYIIGSFQLGFFADLPPIEQVKNVLNGAIISLYLTIFYYLTLHRFLMPIRRRLVTAFQMQPAPTGSLQTKMAILTGLVAIGSMGLLSLIVFDSFQVIARAGAGSIGLTALLAPEIVANALLGGLLIVGLAVGVILYVAKAFTFEMRRLTTMARRASAPSYVVPTAIHSGDEIESLSVALRTSIQALAHERHNLAAEKVRADTILNSVGEGLVVTDNHQRVLMMNHAAEKLIGWSEDEVRGKVWSRVVQVTREDGQPFREERFPLQALLHGERAVLSGRYLYRRKNETSFLVSRLATALTMNGRINGSVIVFRDITRERAADKAKTEFVSLASHQLRTPLTAINWYAELLLRDEENVRGLTDKQRADLERIRVRCQRMVNLVNDLLNVSRLDAGRLKIDPVETDLAAFIQDIVTETKTLTAQYPCHIYFSKPDEPLPLVLVDRILLRQVIYNILVNALKYSRRNQSNLVWVELAVNERQEYIISVQDTGIGIPQHVQPRIFEKFFRADNAVSVETDGTGLGLYISKMIMETAGGSISFESVENQGTTFYIKLPADGMRQRTGEMELAV